MDFRITDKVEALDKTQELLTLFILHTTTWETKWETTIRASSTMMKEQLLENIKLGNWWLIGLIHNQRRMIQVRLRIQQISHSFRVRRLILVGVRWIITICLWLINNLKQDKQTTRIWWRMTNLRMDPAKFKVGRHWEITVIV